MQEPLYAAIFTALSRDKPAPTKSVSEESCVARRRGLGRVAIPELLENPHDFSFRHRIPIVDLLHQSLHDLGVVPGYVFRFARILEKVE